MYYRGVLEGVYLASLATPMPHRTHGWTHHYDLVTSACLSMLQFQWTANASHRSPCALSLNHSLISILGIHNSQVQNQQKNINYTVNSSKAKIVIRIHCKKMYQGWHGPLRAIKNPFFKMTNVLQYSIAWYKAVHTLWHVQTGIEKK